MIEVLDADRASRAVMFPWRNEGHIAMITGLLVPDVHGYQTGHKECACQRQGRSSCDLEIGLIAVD